eukprot:GHVR01179951.1.p1 GENE.GHVR01179951.1~~GHVR01179951.1.p1  ORF type:complete len:827 (+),score=184.85 GHVR01179951.1:212-2482(+)
MLTSDCVIKPVEVKSVVKVSDVVSLFDTSNLIDIGAVFKTYKNKILADELLELYNEIDGVLYFDERSNSLRLLMKDKRIKQVIGTRPEDILKAYGGGGNINIFPKLITYYDHRHITGTDIKQIDDGIAIATVNSDVSLRDLLQGLMRMRKYLTTQKVYFAVSGEFYVSKILNAYSILKEAQKVQFMQQKQQNREVAVQKIRDVLRQKAIEIIFNEIKICKKEKNKMKCFKENVMGKYFKCSPNKLSDSNPIDLFKTIIEEDIKSIYLHHETNDIYFTEILDVLVNNVIKSANNILESTHEISMLTEEIKINYPIKEDKVKRNSLKMDSTSEVELQIEIEMEMELEIKSYKIPNNGKPKPYLREKTENMKSLLNGNNYYSNIYSMSKQMEKFDDQTEVEKFLPMFNNKEIYIDSVFIETRKDDRDHLAYGVEPWGPYSKTPHSAIYFNNKIILHDLHDMSNVENIIKENNILNRNSHPIMLSSPVSEEINNKNPINVNILFSTELQKLQALTLLFTGGMCILDNPSWRYVVKQLLFFDDKLRTYLLNFYYSNILYGSEKQKISWYTSLTMRTIKSSNVEILRYTELDEKEYIYFNQRKKRYAEFYKMKINESPTDQKKVLKSHYPDGQFDVSDRFIFTENTTETNTEERQQVKQQRNAYTNEESYRKDVKDTNEVFDYDNIKDNKQIYQEIDKTINNNNREKERIKHTKDYSGKSLISFVLIGVGIVLFVFIIFVVVVVWLRLKKTNALRDIGIFPN